MAVTKTETAVDAVAAAASKKPLQVHHVPAAKPRRAELPRPPWDWLSWVIMFAYFATFAEAAMLCTRNLDVNALFDCTHRLCGTYALEVLLAVGPGWCAMQGWTRPDVLVHHVPYIMAVIIGTVSGCYVRWTIAMRVSLLTAANEGMLIALALGAPDWVSKFRRLYGFSIVVALMLTEVCSYFVNMGLHWEQGSSILTALPDQWILPAIYYHCMLLKAYIRRWKKTQCL